jgi:serine/threonine-protein kinase
VSDPPETLIGRTLGPYRILDTIGKGGIGVVYRAHDQTLGREIAFKLVPTNLCPHPENIARFKLEVRSLTALNHPHVIAIYEFGQQQSIPYMYIAMELVEGRNVREILAEGPMPIPDVLRLAAQAADGLAKAHEAGIIHRNVKATNLLVSRSGQLTITDFCLLRLVAGSANFLGSLECVAPEQVRGERADFRTDQFFFGNVLFEMATGQQPFRRSDLSQTMLAVASEEPPPIQELNDRVPGEFRTVVERCLAKDPQQRFATMRELAAELERIQLA